MDYEDEMKISIKEIAQHLNSRIECKIKDIAYYKDFINLKNKHSKSTFSEEDILNTLNIEKTTIEIIKKEIEDIFCSNDIPEEYYKIKEEE